MAIDMDAARRERAGEGPKVVFGGEDFVLPAELSFEVVEQFLSMAKADETGAAAADGLKGALKLLLGNQYDAFRAHGPSLQDLQFLFSAMMKEYGFESAGESPASEPS